MYLVIGAINFYFLLTNKVEGIVLLTFFALFGFYLFLSRVFKGKVFIDVILIFPFVFAIYTISYPTFKYLLNLVKVDIRNVSFDSILYGTYVSSTSILIYILIVTLFYKKGISEERFKILPQFRITYRHILFDILALFMLLSYFGNFINVGGLNLLSSNISRLDATILFNEGQYWLIKYFFICYSGYSLISIINKKGFIKKYNFFNLLRLVNIFSFWGISILIGNRRELVYLILLLMLFLFTNNNYIIKFRHKIISVLSGIILLLYGYFRNILFSKEAINIDELILASFGDFFFPIQTLYHYIASPIEMKLGTTYFNIFGMVIPSSIWPDKPESLARQFVIDAGSSIGYAYTPMTEAFINFSYLSILILPLIVFLFFILVRSFSRFEPLLYVVTYMQIVNFNRGEFSSSLLEILIMYFCLRLMYQVNTFNKYDNY